MRFALVLLCGCNSILGLKNTRPSDAPIPFFDGQPDAPFTCPAVGTAPSFSHFFDQVVAVDACMAYTIGGTTAFARCAQTNGTSASPGYEQGPRDAPLDLIATITPMPAGALGLPVLSPDGSELWFSNFTASIGTISVYTAPSSAAQWTNPTTIYQTSDYIVVGTPTSSGPDRRVMILDGYEAHELEEKTPGTWTDIHAYTPAEFGITNFISVVNLTDDGLHAVFAATFGMNADIGVFYLARDHTTDTFGAPMLVTGPPLGVQTPFMTGNCSRLYFSALNSVLYVPSS
jgi:hypothetical protein